jgi:hypothetical protein
MSGELKPNSHVNIEMTIVPSKYPTFFEGEIQCSIDWENGDGGEARSVATMTNVPESSEYLFLRLKKRSKIVSVGYAHPTVNCFVEQDSAGSGCAPRGVSD